MMLSFAVWFALALLVNAEWSYDDKSGNGPSQWKETNSQCAGQKQSPIDIEPTKATVKKDFGKIQFGGYDSAAGYNYEMINNGHAVQVNVKGDPGMNISGGNLPGVYRLRQFNMHWGDRDEVGSEHTINTNSYPLEIHFFHHHTKYDSVDDAMRQSQGLAILAVFAEIGEQNEDFQKIVSKLPTIQYGGDGSKTSITPFALRGLLPSNTKRFARYSGSLTTPGCFESVVWTVFTEPITISANQMAEFRRLYTNREGSSPSNSLVNNFRPVQDLHDRVVQLSYESAAVRTVAPSMLVATAVMVATAWLCYRG